MLTSPLLLVPVLMQLAFLWGAIYAGLLVTFTVMGALAMTGGAWAAFIDTMTFLLGVLVSPAVMSEQIPATLSSPEALAQTISAGVLSWQALVVAIVIGIAVFAGAAATAYTKALALGVISHGIDGRKAGFIEMFRAGRNYWWPVMRYYAPFAALAWIALLLLLPLLTYMLGYLITTQGMQSSLPPAFYVFVLLGAAFLLLRVATTFAESIILDGSRRPVRDALRFSGSNVVQTAKVVALLFLISVVFFVINEGIGWIEDRQIALISAFASVLALLVYALWRLWVAAFVIAVWRSRSLARRMPRAASA